MARWRWRASEEQRRSTSPYRVRNAYRLLSKILKTAVQAGYLPRNMAEGVPLPRIVEGDRTVLTAAEVARFVREMPPERGYDVLVQLLAYGGLRWGEVCALRRGGASCSGHGSLSPSHSPR